MRLYIDMQEVSSAYKELLAEAFLERGMYMPPVVVQKDVWVVWSDSNLIRGAYVSSLDDEDVEALDGLELLEAEV